MRGRHGRSPRYIGRPPKNPGAIAPEFLALFADIAHPRKRVYLAAYVQEGGDWSRSRKTAGGGSQHCYWLRDDPAYRAAFARAKLAVADAAEREVWRAAARAPNSGESLMAFLARLGRERYGEGRKKSRGAD